MAIFDETKCVSASNLSMESFVFVLVKRKNQIDALSSSATVLSACINTKPDIENGIQILNDVYFYNEVNRLDL